MKKLVFLPVLCLLISSVSLFGDSSLMIENAKLYRSKIDQVILDFIQAGKTPDIDQALEIQACENDMLALARLDPSLARSMPALLMANKVKLLDLRHLPGELIVARAEVAGIGVLDPKVGDQVFRYKKGRIFAREKEFRGQGSSEKFPVQGDWIAHHAYARNCLEVGEYEQAAEHFYQAAIVGESKDGTIRKIWEFENLVSSAWAHLLNGSLDKSRELLEMTESFQVQAPPSQRARYLDAVINDQVHPSLNLALKNSLALR
jgi:hypothetical protein